MNEKILDKFDSSCSVETNLYIILDLIFISEVIWNLGVRSRLKMSPGKDQGYYYAEYKHEGMTSAKQAFILQTPIKRERMKPIREVLLRAT